VLVVGAGDRVDAVVMLLQAAGVQVRKVSRPSEGKAGQAPRTLLVDLASVTDPEQLVTLLKAR
jgi:hypothetical protein